MVDAGNTDLRKSIREIRDYPKKGILFRDITTLLKDPDAFKMAMDLIYDHFENRKIDKIVAIESRGFILGSILAYRMRCGFIPARKPNKLPAAKKKHEYQLEYGMDAIEIHIDAIGKNEQVLIIDDLLATGGTCFAACKLVEELGGTVAGVAFLIELSYLNGRVKLQGYDIFSLLKYASE